MIGICLFRQWAVGQNGIGSFDDFAETAVRFHDDTLNGATEAR
jgi:hypothetical protein